MPTTDHGRVIRDLCTKAMRDPESAARVAAVLDELRNGRGPRPYVDAVFQNWEGKATDYDDAFAFGCIDYWVATGRVLVHTVHIGHGPFGDHEQGQNNTILATLPAPYQAEFRGGKGGRAGDGRFVWTAPIMAHRHGTPNTPNDHAEIEVEAGSAILEVGTTAASRTYDWLFNEHRLARWPYGSEWITLFIPTVQLSLDKTDAMERWLSRNLPSPGGSR